MDKQEKSFFIEMARKDLLSFCVFTDKFFEIAPHHELIQEALDKVVSGEIQNLVISMPPRAGKSRIMREFIAKLYGDHPRTDILYTGHSLSLLEGFSRDIKNRIEGIEYKQLYSTKIMSGSDSVKNWKVQGGGEFAIYGVGGGITGKGGDILIIDDPYGTRQDAESDTIRRTVSDWYWSTFLSRRQNQNAKQIIIMQRWREDDLIGEILERDGENWTELKIPALNEEGESFWQSRFNKEYFEEIKRQNPIFFQSQYQQDPINEGGGDFKKEYFRYCEKSELNDFKSILKIVTFVDPAISDKQEGDFTAIVTVGHDIQSNLRYLLEVKKLKTTPDEIINELFFTVKEWQHFGISYKCGIEDVQYQRMLIMAVQNKMREKDTHFVLEAVRPSGEKNARIRSILQPLYASYSFVHVRSHSISDYELELMKFPNGKHDDMIDSCTGACSLLQSTNINTPQAQVISFRRRGE